MYGRKAKGVVAVLRGYVGRDHIAYFVQIEQSELEGGS